MNKVADLAIGLAASRILVIDDNQAIHQDFRKIFGASRSRPAPSAAERALFGGGAQLSGAPEFQIDSAYQGQEGLELVRLAQEQGSPYAMAFVDVRMPPGWDGIETTARIWQQDPDIQIVLCTAYSDYSWSEMLAKLGRSDRLVILKKPFDTIEVVQLASALTEKWRLARESHSTLEDLEQRVAERTRELVQSDEKIKRLNRVYAVLSGITTLIVRVRERDELFREACRIAVEAGGFRMAWIGLVDKEAGLVKPVASAGDVRDFFELAPLAITDTKAGGHGLTGRAVRDRKAVVSNDVSNDPQRMMKPELFERGINSLAILPLLDGGQAVGVLALYAAEAGAFDEHEMALLRELAGDIAFALEHIGKAEKLDRMTRVNAMLSGINGAIARIRGRQELFEEACRIAVATGGLRFAWLCVVDEAGMRLRAVATAGADGGFVEMVRNRLSLRDDAPEGHGIVTRSVREKRAVVVNDIEADAGIRNRQAHIDGGIKAVASLPLFIAGRVVATFGLHAAEAGFFDDDEMKLLHEVVGNIAFALEHIEKEDKVQRLTRVYAVLSGINALIVRTRDRGELLKEACRIAVDEGGLPMAWIGMVDPSVMKIRLVASAGLNEGILTAIKDRLAANDSVPLGNNLAARAIREKRAGVSNDAQNDSRLVLSKDHVESGLRSMAMLPLLVSGEAVGVFGLYSDETGFFDEEEMKLLTELAGHIAFALAHIEAAEKLDRMTRVNAMLSGINGAIVRIRDRQELFEEACRIAVETGGLPFAWLCVVDEAEARLRPVASAGPDDGFLEAIRDRLSLLVDAPEGQGIGPRAVREKRALVVNDVVVDADFRYTKAHADHGIKSAAALPLLIAGRAVGAIALYAAEVGFFDEDEMKLLNEVAGNIAFALENIEKEEKVQRLTRVYAVLSGINALIVRVRERDELFREACRVAVEQGKFAMAWIGAFDPETQDVTPVAWAGESSVELTRVKSSARADTPHGIGAIGQSIRARRPIFNNNILTQTFSGPRLKEILRLGFQSYITLPLYEDQAVVGTLTMYTRERDYFDEEEVRLLTELAGDISFALQNISLQQKLDKLARIRAVSSEINATIVRVRERKALLEETCRIVSEHGKFEMIWIGALDHDAGQVEPIAWKGFTEETARAVSWESIGVPGGMLGEAIETRKASVRNDIEGELPGGKLRGEALKRGCNSSACLPLVVDDGVTALLVLFGTGREFFDKDELALLDEVASDISFALQAIEEEKKVRRLTRVYAVLSGINTLIIRARDREELFREACRIAVSEGGFILARVLELDPEGRASIAATSEPDPRVYQRIIDEYNGDPGHSQSLVALALRDGRPLISNDVAADPRIPDREVLTKDGNYALALLPLIVEKRVAGAIVLRARETGTFDDAEMRLLLELVSNLSFALELMEKQQKLDYLAYYDPLTGLANRSLFLERVGQFMRSAAGGGHKLALFLFDLERFKSINDSLGRPAGDSLLKLVAQWLTRNLGDANLFARVDADHFAIVLPVVRQDGDVIRLLEKTMAAFLEHPFQLNDAVFRIAAKVGAALFPDDGADADTLFKNAEAALKKAKAGGDRYLFYTQGMTATVATKLTLENQLRQALDREEFVLHYQPKVSLVTGKLTGAEALIRWNDPRTGLVPPARFIPVLEETGLIYEVGRWALRKAIEDYLRWRAAGLPAVRIAVNVSPLQLRNRGFLAEIEQATGVDTQAAAGLELEITESLIMEDIKHNIASLQAIRAMGVTIAIDDFGTGFSSLSYLSKLPVDTLKIDRSFVIDMTAAPEGLALVSTIVTLAHSLKLKVVAEGVETEEQSHLLRGLRCDEMQGYLFSKPLPGELFETRFLASRPAG